jgi:hypothetical protein
MQSFFPSAYVYVGSIRLTARQTSMTLSTLASKHNYTKIQKNNKQLSCPFKFFLGKNASLAFAASDALFARSADLSTCEE